MHNTVQHEKSESETVENRKEKERERWKKKNMNLCGINSVLSHAMHVTISKERCIGNLE